MEIERFFGIGKPFTVACEIVMGNQLPVEIRLHARTLGKSQTAFLLGYAMGKVCKDTGFAFNILEIKQIADGKISYGDPGVFVDAFREMAYKK